MYTIKALLKLTSKWLIYKLVATGIRHLCSINQYIFILLHINLRYILIIPVLVVINKTLSLSLPLPPAAASEVLGQWEGRNESDTAGVMQGPDSGYPDQSLSDQKL